MSLDEWLDLLRTELDAGLSEDDQKALLDLARVVAHRVERRGAPLTTYLIGYAAGRSGRPAGDIVRELMRVARELPPEEASG